MRVRTWVCVLSFVASAGCAADDRSFASDDAGASTGGGAGGQGGTGGAAGASGSAGTGGAAGQGAGGAGGGADAGNPPACSGPNAVNDTSHCDAGTPWWCASSNTCWKEQVDCWTVTECASGGIGHACACGKHFDCASNACVDGVQYPGCDSQMQATSPSTCGTGRYQCPNNGTCWSFPGDCATQTRCTGTSGPPDVICACGKHADCTLAAADKCVPW